jgi:hypothetical protein
MSLSYDRVVELGDRINQKIARERGWPVECRGSITP